MILKPASPCTRVQGRCQFGVGSHADEDELRLGEDEDSEDEAVVAASQEQLQGVAGPGAPLSCQYSCGFIGFVSGLSCPQGSCQHL